MLERPEVLEALIRDYYQKTGVQLQVLIIPSLEEKTQEKTQEKAQKETIESFSMKVVEKWKLGGKKNDGGLLFLITQKERQMRIEVGYGLEGLLTDLESSIILDGVSKYFKKGLFDQGVAYALNQISHKIGKEPFLDKELKSDSNFPIFIFIFILLVWILIASTAGKNSQGRDGSMHGTGRKRRRSWRDDDDFFGGGGFGGGSSGGGFGGWSGGGGGFGGGGASGSW